jgi:hypothetical protein
MNLHYSDHAWRSLRQLIALSFALTCLAATSALAAARKNLSVKWADLNQLVVGKKIELVLQGGLGIQGKVLVVKPDALRLRVTSTSDEKVLKPGVRGIPRSSVSLIRMEKLSKRWRAILTPAVPAVALLGMSVAASRVHPLPDPIKLGEIAVGITAAAALGGYVIGRHLDVRERVQITALPD